MSDSYTQLNPGIGGDIMDESVITYGSSPTTRKRPRVVITGEGANELASAPNTAPIGSEFGLVTRPIQQYPGIPITNFGLSTLIPNGSETTISSYLVPTAKTFFFTGFAASGTVDAYYKLYVDGNIVLASRSSVAVPSVNLTFTIPPFNVAEGLVVEIKVVQSSGLTATQCEGTILGYII